MQKDYLAGITKVLLHSKHKEMRILNSIAPPAWHQLPNRLAAQHLQDFSGSSWLLAFPWDSSNYGTSSDFLQTAIIIPEKKGQGAVWKKDGIMAYSHIVPFSTQNQSLFRLNFVLLCEQHTRCHYQLLRKILLQYNVFWGFCSIKIVLLSS